MRALRILDERAAAIRDRVAGAIGAAIAGGADPAAAAGYAHAAMDEEGRRAVARSPIAPACAAGCAWCCHVHADATVPEILAIAAHLARTRSREALAALRDRLADHVARVEGLSDAERWARRVPCALLGEGGRCSIYEARPLRCRAFFSADAEVCRAAHAGADVDPVTIPAIARAAAAVEEGYDRALAAAGLGAEAYRFEIGLLVALDDPRAGERWRAGEDAFARARPPA